MDNNLNELAFKEIIIYPSEEPYMHMDPEWLRIAAIEESSWRELTPDFKPTSFEPFHCECCGAPLHIKVGAPATVCEYCGNAYIWR